MVIDHYTFDLHFYDCIFWYLTAFVAFSSSIVFRLYLILDNSEEGVRMSLVSIGPSGIGGEYQWEW